jgi:hypothetical protein
MSKRLARRKIGINESGGTSTPPMAITTGMKAILKSAL